MDVALFLDSKISQMSYELYLRLYNSVINLRPISEDLHKFLNIKGFHFPSLRNIRPRMTLKSFVGGR